MMKFLYNTALGRLLLKILLHAKVLKFMERIAKAPVSKIFIKWYIKKNKIDMTDFPGQTYESFADFFSRRRCVEDPITSWTDGIISPCDGLVSIAEVNTFSRFNVKGSSYSMSDLIPEPSVASQFDGGLCMIFRLRASDYHHFCYIDNCKPGKTHFIPGMLHSVQPIALAKEPVFRLNRRVWSIMETENFGPVAQVEVGAVLVGGIVHEPTGEYAPRGSEMGHFELCGSTILLFFRKDIRDSLQLCRTFGSCAAKNREYPVRMGEIIAHADRRGELG